MTDHINDTSSIDKAVAYIIVNSGRHLKLHLQRNMRQYNISPEQWFLLFRLYEEDGRSQKELADQHAYDFPNITRLIDALSKKNFVKRQVDPEDRRKHRIFLTAEGHQLMNEIFPRVKELRQEIFNGISQEELTTMVSTLRKIEANLFKYTK